MKLIKENLNVELTEDDKLKASRVADYRKYANIDENERITTENIDEYALNKTSAEHNYDVECLRKELTESKLTEATIGQNAEEAAEVLDAGAVAKSKGVIEDALDWALDYNEEEIAEGGDNFKNVLLIGEAGVGKAQPLTSKVYTPTGFKLMRDIQVNDIVLDGTGEPTKVTEIFPQKDQHNIYHINFNDNTYIEVADNHLNSVYRVWPRYSTNSVGREDLVLETTDLINLVNSKNYGKCGNPKLFVDIPTVKFAAENKLPINPYLLGCLLGDGSIHTGLGFTSADSEIVGRVDEILRHDWDLCLSHTGNQPACMFAICNKDHEVKSNRKEARSFINELEKLNLRQTSDKKFIPDCYKYSSVEDRLALIQGLMDTDGTIGKAKKSIFSGKYIGGKCLFSSVSEQLVDDVAFILRSLGCRVTLEASKANRTYCYKYKDKVEVRPCKQSYTLYIACPNNLCLFRLSRKAERLCENRFEPRKSIESITFDRIDDCKCIMVASENHTYLTDNLTVTHNTARVKAWAKENGINLFSVKAATMDDPDVGGAVAINPDDPHTVINLSPTQFDQLDRERSVLFLDELNRARDTVRGNLLTLIKDHTIVDNRVEGGERFFPNFLFTVAAINPSNMDYNTNEMDRAERDRFREINVPAEWNVLYTYLSKELDKKIASNEAQGKDVWKKRNEGRKRILNALNASDERGNILDDEKEMKSASNRLITSARSFTNLLTSTDGTKEDFLSKWSQFCNSDKKKKIELILKNYRDVDDKANDALKSGTESNVFKSKKSTMDMIRDLIPDLD